MPNHYTNMAIVYPGDVYGRALVAALRGWAKDAFVRVMPPPSPEEMAEQGGGDLWARKNWGCRDCYDVAEPVELPGDCGAVLISFCTAWGPPNERMLALLSGEIVQTKGARKVVWLGLDPYDSSIDLLAGAMSCHDDLVSLEAARLLDCPASGFIVRGWLDGAGIEGAYQLPDGEWRYPLAAIRQARVKLDRIRAANEAGVVLMPEPSDNLPPIPTFKGDQ